MQYIRNSWIYSVWLLLSAWCARQWNQSLIVTWFVSQKQTGSGLYRLSGPVQRVFEKLKLSRIIEKSIFLHPELFAALALLLAPVCPTMVVFAAVCGGFLSLLLSAGCGRLEKHGGCPVSKWVILFAAIYLYATLTSVTVSGSLFAGAITILFVLCFELVISCTVTRKQLRLLLDGVLLAGTLVACYGFWQKLNPGSFRNVWTDTDMFSEVTFRVYSTLENPNVLGEYFLLIIPVGAAAVLTAETRLRRIAYLAASAAMAVCLVLTYSRGCYLGILFAAAVFLVLLDRRLILVGIAALLVSPFVLPESVLHRFTSIGNMGDTSTSYRVYIWLGTLEMLKDYWFCGVGPGTNAFNMVYPDYAYNAVTSPHSHNLFLQLVCDTGICGLLIFLALLVSWYRMMFTAMHRGTDRRMRIFQIAAVSAISGFLVESVTDYTFYNYRVLLMFWLLLGVSVLMTRTGSADAPADRAGSTESEGKL